MNDATPPLCPRHGVSMVALTTPSGRFLRWVCVRCYVLGILPLPRLGSNP